jgi:3-hydroxypropanoate dehydrogenase
MPDNNVQPIDARSRHTLFTEAHTAHAFSTDAIDEAVLEELYELIKFAPTSMNSQPLRIVFVRSESARQRLITHLADGNKAKTASAPLTAVLAFDAEFHEHLPTIFPNLPNAKELFADETRRHEFAKGQAWLQAGYFIVGARALGYAVGPMTGFNATGLDADLLADTTLQSICVVNIGVPSPDAFKPRLPRLAYDQTVTVV